MSYYIKYSPSEDKRYLPDVWKSEQYFEICLSRGDVLSIEPKEQSYTGDISEADMIEADVKEWYAEHGGEMTDFDREFLENMRKAEAEARGAIDTKAIDKAYRVNLVKQEMADAEMREHWARVDASVGRWLEFEPGKYVWENYKEGEGDAKPVLAPLVKKKAPVKKKAEEVVKSVPLVVPLPITRVEVTLGGKDIVIELTSASDIPAILVGLKEQHGFSEKMKKKLDALLTANKPT